MTFDLVQETDTMDDYASIWATEASSERTSTKADVGGISMGMNDGLC